MFACGALAMIAAVQFLVPADPPPRDPAGLAARRTRPVTLPPAPEYAAILTAPIFAPDRRPGDPGGALAPGSASLESYAALGAATGRAVAAGVVSAPGGKVQTLRLGDEVEGWRLVGVSRTRLSFERNGARHDLIVGAPAEADSSATKLSNSTPAADQ
jgi:hypothetical protein